MSSSSIKNLLIKNVNGSNSSLLSQNSLSHLNQSSNNFSTLNKSNSTSPLVEHHFISLPSLDKKKKKKKKKKTIFNGITVTEIKKPKIKEKPSLDSLLKMINSINRDRNDKPIYTSHVIGKDNDIYEIEKAKERMESLRYRESLSRKVLL